ncbi:hypothetical protein [Streptomyces sp. NPDC052012]|uniref:TolB family protein n=1 Tax=Streptomyces sp. NPDC052012 TaxID=3155051 RepID=UPI00344B450A
MSTVMRAASAALITGALALVSTVPAAAAPGPGTERITVSATGEQGDDHAYGPHLSADGRFAVFTAAAENLVPGDSNKLHDVFVRDLRKGTVERVNVASDGTQADGMSSALDISSDGRYVLFLSRARNLAAWETPPADDFAEDVYLHDRRTGRTERVSAGLDGGSAYAFGGAMSADARYVAFSARPNRMEADDPNIFRAVYLLDRRTGDVRRVANREHPGWPAQVVGVSADGRKVAYSQIEYRGPRGALWVYDRRTGTEEQANVTAGGTPSSTAPLNASFSADGRRVAFESSAADLVPGDTNEQTDVFVRDLRGDTTTRVTHDSGEASGVYNPALSPDGRYVAYEAAVRGDDGYLGPSNVYLRDLRTGATRLVSESLTGGPVTDEYVTVYSVTRGGGAVGFSSDSASLVTGDTNGRADGFVRRMR